MKVDELNLAKWFKNRLRTIMTHNGYMEDMLDVDTCEEQNKWTPIDLIAREYLNNGGGSAKGFLGITPSECCKCYDYICENKDYIVANRLVSEKAWNNSGFPLWSEYDYDYAQEVIA